MPRLTRIYTRTGDDGSTALGSGTRVAKDNLRVDCYGTVDELNSQLGVALSQAPPESLAAPLARIQNDLFHLGADLCVTEADKAARPLPRIEARHVEWVEEQIDAWNARLPALDNFILPGGCSTAAQLHVARTVCRRAERILVALARQEPVGDWALPYLNRLSDLLFVYARAANLLTGEADRLWDSHA
ncbi:MAG: cob(I)alamin adenosyltransferase [Acidobacteriota bacterium]|nr:cob(I)alamin adenosyltransferase [Acidobacteriota bacterium]